MLVRRLREQLQIDKSLAYAVAARAWQAASGPATIVVLIASLSEAEQGVYYTLVTVVGIQLFFELGLLNVLISQAGNLVAGLDTESGLRQMYGLTIAARRWFGFASLLFAACAVATGWMALRDTTVSLSWQLPLLSLVAISAGTVALSPSLAVLEGAGYRDDVNRYRMFQMVSGSLVVWTAVACGLKLWALVLAAGVQLVWSIYVIAIVHQPFFLKCRTAVDGMIQDQDSCEFSWRRDVIPIQWRYALNSGVYHLATQFFTLIVITFHSEEEAGRLGMTLSVSGAIQSLAFAWLFTKFPLVSAEHGRGNREAAGTLWRKTAIVSGSLLATALLAAVGTLAAFAHLNVGIQSRFIEPWQFLVLAVGYLANHCIALQGFYVLSQKAKPLLAASLTGFASVGIAVWVGGYYYSISGIVWGYAIAMAGIALPLHTIAYLIFRAQKRDIAVYAGN